MSFLTRQTRYANVSRGKSRSQPGPCCGDLATRCEAARLGEVVAAELDEVGGILKLNRDWRREDREQAVLSACSSLISVVDYPGSRIVQFSRFSVKECLTLAGIDSSLQSEKYRDIIVLNPLAQPLLGPA